MIERSDEELVSAGQQGDRDALELVLRRNFERIYVICRRITCNHEDAKDATQEALIAVYRSLQSFDRRASFSTWLYRIATNAAFDEVRRRSRRPAPVDEAPLLVGCATGIGEQWLGARLEIDNALARLHPDLRAPLVLRDLHGLEYATIAEILDWPEGTVRSRLHRARQAIRHMLRPRASDNLSATGG